MLPLLDLIGDSADCMPDCIITASDVEKGRPAPDMIREACRRLGIAEPNKDSVWKVGDTLLDIQEGVNAKVTTIGVSDTGNEMGHTAESLESLKKLYIFRAHQKCIEEAMFSEGADAVIPSVASLNQYLHHS